MKKVCTLGPMVQTLRQPPTTLRQLSLMERDEISNFKKGRAPPPNPKQSGFHCALQLLLLMCCHWMQWHSYHLPWKTSDSRCSSWGIINSVTSFSFILTKKDCHLHVCICCAVCCNCRSCNCRSYPLLFFYITRQRNFGEMRFLVFPQAWQLLSKVDENLCCPMRPCILFRRGASSVKNTPGKKVSV